MRKTDPIGVPRHAALFVLALGLIFAGMLVLNGLTPLQADDYDYLYSWDTGKPLAGFLDILRSQAAHYRLWGGRSVTHTLTQTFLYLGKPLFNVFSAFAYVVLLLEILRLGGISLRSFPSAALLFIHLCLFLFVPYFGVVFLWLDGACNYLFGTVLALLPLLMTISRLSGGLFSRAKMLPVMLFLFFIGGWTNENTAAGILAAGALLFVTEWKRQGRLDKAWLAGLLLEAAGVALMLLAPGNRERAGAYVMGNIFLEYGRRTVYVLYYGLRFCGIVGIPMITLLWLNRKRDPFTVHRLVCALAALLAILALVGSPEVSDRTYLGPFVLLLSQCVAEARLALQGKKEPRFMPAALLALSLGLFILAGHEVHLHAQRWQQQLDRIEAARQAGETAVTLEPVPSRSRYTMSIPLEQEPDLWPNRTLSRWSGLDIHGSAGPK